MREPGVINNVLKLLFFVMVAQLAACSDEDVVSQTLTLEELGSEQVPLNCSVEELRNKANELNRIDGSSQFHSMLSFAQQEKKKNHFEIMSNKKIREYFKNGKESAVFISNKADKITISNFNVKTNFNIFAKASSFCNKNNNGLCVPAIYYDGKREFCLLFSEDDLMK